MPYSVSHSRKCKRGKGMKDKPMKVRTIHSMSRVDKIMDIAALVTCVLIAIALIPMTAIIILNFNEMWFWSFYIVLTVMCLILIVEAI